MLDWYILVGVLIFTNTSQAFIIGRLCRKCSILQYKCDVYETALNRIKELKGGDTL